MIGSSKPVSSRCRRLAICAVLVVMLLAAARLATLQGLIKPVRIHGGSMAETFCGNHRELVCGDCGFSCRYDAEYPPADERVVCPNCGLKNHEPSDVNNRRGDRVLIDRLVHTIRSPRRWEIVAFRTPGAPDHLAVKRVIGLPGEHVSIRRGDVYVDGQLAHKSLGDLRDMAILVHDNAYQPRADRDLPPRWQAESATSGWHIRRGTLAFSPERDSSREFDWLTYRHWRCVPGPAPRTEEYAVLDNYGYNQQLSRELRRVTDLMLVCRMRCTWNSGRLAFQIRHAADCFRVVLLPGDNEGGLFWNDRLLETFPLPAVAYARDVKFELALCDGRVLFAADECVLVRSPYERTAGPDEPVSRPIAIGAIGVSMDIRRLQVFRDLHFLDPNGLGRDWTAPVRLGSDEFFVTGDNAPISEDSRHWPEAGVSRRLLLGKVLRRL